MHGAPWVGCTDAVPAGPLNPPRTLRAHPFPRPTIAGPACRLGRRCRAQVDGDVRTSMLGAEYAWGPLVAGMSLSHSRSLGSYEGVDGGQVASSVTGLYPWVGYKATDRITLWGVTGYGLGSLSLAPTIGSAPTTMDLAVGSGLSMAMAAGGTRGELIGAGAGSGFRLAFKADALWVGTSIDEVNACSARR